MKNDFYTKETKGTKQKPSIDILSLIDDSVKISLNFNLIKNGTNVNDVFSANPVPLDSFLTGKYIIPKDYRYIGPKGQTGQTGQEANKTAIAPKPPKTRYIQG